MTHNKELKEKWIQTLEDFENDSLTKSEFCEKNDLKINQFNYWENKLTNLQNIESEQPSFIKVNTIDSPILTNEIIILIKGIKIIIPNEFNPSTLLKVINLVKASD